MAKQVNIKSGIAFRTLTMAKEHYSGIRVVTPLGENISEPERSNILDIYERYCISTAYADAVPAIDVTTVQNNDQRPGGTYATTKSFAVVDTSGQKHSFSIDKALTAIAA